MWRLLEKQKGELTDFDLFWQEKGKRDGGECAQIDKQEIEMQPKKIDKCENISIFAT